jgi:hypothetical protein
VQKTRHRRAATTKYGAGGAGVENSRARQRALHFCDGFLQFAHGSLRIRKSGARIRKCGIGCERSPEARSRFLRLIGTQ